MRIVRKKSQVCGAWGLTISTITIRRFENNPLDHSAVCEQLSYDTYSVRVRNTHILGTFSVPLMILDFCLWEEKESPVGVLIFFVKLREIENGSAMSRVTILYYCCCFGACV